MDFINESDLVFKDQWALWGSIKSELAELGAKRFMEGPDPRAQRAREAFAEYFFLMAQKKYSNIDWWLHQPADSFPDFELINFAEEPENIEFYSFELVTIPPICNSLQDAFKIVQGKIQKGYPDGYNLLVFFNHPMSQVWASALGEHLKERGPFNTIWTLYILFEKDFIAHSAVTSRILAKNEGPRIDIQAKIGDIASHVSNALPPYFDQIEIGERKYITPKKAFLEWYRRENAKRKRSIRSE